MPINLPTLTVADAAAWRQWLAQNNAKSKAILVTVAMKDTVALPTSLRYSQALDEALCYGWIDSGGHKRADLPGAHYFRFTKRKPNGLWSKRNVGYVERLQKEGRLQAPGIASVEAAKADGRWDSAYAGSATAELPSDFLTAVEAVPAAKVTFDTLNRGNRWAIYFRLLQLKTQKGREKRIQAYVDMLANGQTPIPQKKAAHSTDKGVSMAAERHVSEATSDTPTEQLPARRTRSGRMAPSYKE